MTQGVGQERRAARFREALSQGSDPWTDLGLTLPIFVGYHLGVVFLDKINAADFVTGNLIALARTNVLGYWALTLGDGAAMVVTLLVMGRGRHLSWPRFAVVALEGAVYAALMSVVASFIVGKMRLGMGEGLIMSLGAGFYEELAFRVVLFGLGGKLIVKLLKGHQLAALLAWGVVTSVVFSLWHYTNEPFRMDSFVFRTVCGMFFVAIYKFRGFAPAVWTHALYDVWVLAL